MKLLNKLQKELVAELADAGKLTEFTKARLQELLRQTTTLINSSYGVVSETMRETLTGVGAVTSRHIASAFEAAVNEIGHIVISATLPPPMWLEKIVSNTLISGAPSGTWWKRQSLDIQFRFANAVRIGIARSETNADIIDRVRGTKTLPGVMDVSRRNAESLVRSSVQAVAAESRRETFRRNKNVIKGIRQVSVLDGRTTDICIAYSNGTWDLDLNPIPPTTRRYASEGSLAADGGVPRHWACRSAEVAITKTYKELGIDLPEPEEGMRAAEGETVPEGTEFEDWLARRSVAQQDEQLGVGRAQMWREGKITLSNLLDLRGNPLTLAELRAKYGS